ncbi:MAG: addiction module toxin, HicA family [Acidimicrobiia bacterium]|nr:addiction module toxin, HicA family [Acidimicrobiia bacterium]
MPPPIRYRSVKAEELRSMLFAAGFRAIGSRRKRGSHQRLRHPDGRTVTFYFHKGVTVGPTQVKRLLADKAKLTEDEIRAIL